MRTPNIDKQPDTKTDRQTDRQTDMDGNGQTDNKII